jgi:hypothetical protein
MDDKHVLPHAISIGRKRKRKGEREKNREA